MEDNSTDIFIRYKKYKNAKNPLSTSIPDIESIKDNCLFILDTNVLLKLYETNTEDLNEVKKIYLKLIKENRLFIPGQVIREFIDNRPNKLKNIDHTLSRHIENVRKSSENKFLEFKYEKYPLLSDMEEFKSLIDLEDKLKKQSTGNSKQNRERTCRLHKTS